MTETPNEPATPAGETPVTAAVPGTVPAPVTPAGETHATTAVPGTAPAPEPVTGRRPRPRRIAAVLGCLVLAAAVIGGVGYTGTTVADADRAPGTPRWTAPKAAAGETEPRAAGLAAALVPYRTDDWLPGPDLGEFGADAVFSGARATALRKEALRGLPRTQRRQLEKEIDRRPVTGMAMRSYVHSPRWAEEEKGSVTVGVVLARMESAAAVREMATVQNEFFAALDVFRAGPEIKGHENARCFLPPADSHEELDMMICSASQGDVLVSLTADGVKPFDADSVATLLAGQLDRIAEPGEAV